MEQIVRGDTNTFYCTYSNTMNVPTDPVDPFVTIWKEDVQVTDPIPMIRISVGYYYADWVVPTNQDLGQYSAVYTGTIDGLPFQAEEEFEIMGTPTPSILNYYCTWDDIKACLLGLDVGDMPATLQDRIEHFHIPNLKMEIDNYCHQNFNRTTITEFYDGSGTDKIILNRRPVASFASCVLRVIPSISWYTFMRWRQVNVIDSQGVTVATQGGPEPHSGKYPPYSTGDYDWESDITKADLFVDCVSGILVIPPRILYLEMNAIPFWNYTWLRGNNTVEVTYDYGYDGSNFPKDLRLAAAKLAACQILIAKGITASGGGASSIGLDGVSRSFGAMPYAGLIEDMRKQAFAILDKFRRMQI